MTLFNYNCDCSYSGPLKNNKDSYICPNCRKKWDNENDIIIFTDKKNSQTDVYDNIYSSGYISIEQKKTNAQTDAYKTHEELAYSYFKSLGYNLNNDVENLSILDVACGSGWTTAALFCNDKLQNCKIHAFDISISGIKLLKQYLNTQRKSNSKNHLELSVQDAMNMKFSNNSFDVIIGSSILHHFDHYEHFLDACFNILKPSGKAIFGEPFAIGYGIVYSAMKLASIETKVHEKSIDKMYNDSSVRIEKSGDHMFLENLVDKHLYLPDELLEVGRNIGFRKVEIKPLNSLEDIKDELIYDLYKSMGINGLAGFNVIIPYKKAVIACMERQKLIKKTIEIYNVFFDMFKSYFTYNRTLSPFNYVIFQK